MLRGLAILLALAACDDAAEVIVGVATDLEAPTKLDRIRLQVDQHSPHDWQLSGRSSQPYGLPASFAVYSDDGTQAMVTVVITGSLGPRNIIHRQASFTLARGKALFLRMALENRCLDATGGSCPGDETCVEGTCVPSVVENSILPAYQTDKEKVLDCQSGSILLDTGSGTAMRLLGTGTCPADQRCCEGTCYLGRSPCDGA